MWIRKREYETLIGRYRSAVAIEQGRVGQLRKIVESYEELLSEANREIGRLTEEARSHEGMCCECG